MYHIMVNLKVWQSASGGGKDPTVKGLEEIPETCGESCGPDYIEAKVIFY